MRLRRSFRPFLFALGSVALCAACFFDPTPPPQTSGLSPVIGADGAVFGPCTVQGGSVPPAAPRGYYVNGATVCTEAGQPHLFHGVDRPSLEFGPLGDHISFYDFQSIVGWNANVVRIALNQDYWLSGAALYDAGYEALIIKTVGQAEAAGLDVILDLHWSDRGNLQVQVAGGTSKQDTDGDSNQQQMADVNSITFWSQVAADFKNDGRVLFELYNEPNSIPWSVWLNGGMATGFQVAGMQQLYKAVRDTGAQNIVIAGGLAYAFDLSGVANNRIVGYNIMYAAHAYYKNDPGPSSWEHAFGYLATQNIAPVIATEFGDPSTKTVNGNRVDACTGDWDSQLIAFAANHQISWTAWAWYPSDCGFPALISDWDYTPTVQGLVVKAALATYPPTPIPVIDAGIDSGDASPTGDGAAPDASIDATVGGDASALNADAAAPADTTVGDGSAADATVGDGSAADATVGDGSSATDTGLGDDGALDDAAQSADSE